MNFLEVILISLFCISGTCKKYLDDLYSHPDTNHQGFASPLFRRRHLAIPSLSPDLAQVEAFCIFIFLYLFVIHVLSSVLLWQTSYPLCHVA